MFLMLTMIFSEQFRICFDHSFDRSLTAIWWAFVGLIRGVAVVSATGGLNTHRFNRRIIINGHHPPTDQQPKTPATV